MDNKKEADQHSEIDNSTVEKAVAGDPIALVSLYDRYARDIYRYLYSRVGNAADAEDLTAQTFMAVIESLPRYRHRGHFSAWIYQIARNKAMDLFRKQRQDPIDLPYDTASSDEIMEQVIEAVGAETVSWTHRLECCGANFTLSRPGVVIQLTNLILDSAKAAGADCIMVGCPLCHGNLDIRQKEIEGVYNVNYGLPVFYITQLVGLAAGLGPDKLGLDAMIVNPLPLLKEKGLL